MSFANTRHHAGRQNVRYTLGEWRIVAIAWTYSVCMRNPGACLRCICKIQSMQCNGGIDWYRGLMHVMTFEGTLHCARTAYRTIVRTGSGRLSESKIHTHLGPKVQNRPIGWKNTAPSTKNYSRRQAFWENEKDVHVRCFPTSASRILAHAPSGIPYISNDLQTFASAKT